MKFRLDLEGGVLMMASVSLYKKKKLEGGTRKKATGKHNRKKTLTNDLTAGALISDFQPPEMLCKSPSPWYSVVAITEQTIAH
jgi:hypothetical protein